MSRWKQLSSHLYLWEDTCNAYLITSGDSAIAVDFGSGEMLEHLSEIGIKKIEYILHTHHHRDQCQGDCRAVKNGVKILVPESEQDLFSHVDHLWQSREILNNYTVRQDRFSLLEPIEIANLLCDMATWKWREYDFLVLPTPGHTPGSISLITTIDGDKCAFTGDLIYAGGKVWSLAAMQWTYNSQQGLLATLYSINKLKNICCKRFLPSHGPNIDDPFEAMNILRNKFQVLSRVRNQGLDWEERISKPCKQVTPHLIEFAVSEVSNSKSWVLIGKGGKALMIDAGYFFSEIQIVSGFDRASRRILPPPMEQLESEYGINSIDVVIPTHYHDDHTAAIPTLKRIFGTEAWVPENFADIFVNPEKYDLPCLCFDPLPVDRVLPLNKSVKWQDYNIRILDFPGHTHYSVAIFFEVDGKKVLAIGDQHANDPYLWNYVYQNRFALGDYPATFALYKQLKPDIILPGHISPFEVNKEILDAWSQNAKDLDRAHRELLPLDDFNWDAGGVAAYIHPYQAKSKVSQWSEVIVYMKNPYHKQSTVSAELIVPEQWKVRPEKATKLVSAGQWEKVVFEVCPSSSMPLRRVPVAVDITVEGKRIGQVAECLFEVAI